MDWLLYIIAFIFFLLSVVCTVLVVLQLPGAWIMLALACLIEYLDRFYLSDDGAQETFGWPLLAGCGALLVVGEIIEFLAGAVGAQQGGATRRGIIGSLIGGIVGAVVLTPVVPPIGPLLGAVGGTFVGAVIGEVTGPAPMEVRGSMRPAVWASVGRVVGTMTKVGIAIVLLIVLTITAFWP